uniref:U2A'/phosphoprotein 32 family A C-terminal domain-containing protein n=1 Tax=Globisporangium ultimum (strain ATCC 200006 / CBS 805.95 / DAOM BR144) TaxID=431595 RepID=K3X269_GLOUD
MRRGSVGLDGAEAQYCDLSGRGLSTLQIERTLCVFEAADAIDLSNNEIESVPSTIPPTILALDLSFNLIANAQGVDRLKNLQEIHLGFNRLMDVSVLEFCPLLQHVNLSGNRLMNTRGLETLAFLENLNLSENLIEFPEALRPLSLNLHLTHLTLRGNPIAINTKNDYRVLLLDMIPSVLMLDDKKIRNAVKCKTVKVCDPQQDTTASRDQSEAADRW